VVELDHLRRLLKTCDGTDFESRRDCTMFSILLDTGARLSELAGMKLDDIDMRLEVVVVKGKGDRDRALPLSPRMLEILGRYLRVRGRHKAADSPWLWLGKRGRLSSGIAQALKRRAEEAVIPHITPQGLGRAHSAQRLNSTSPSAGRASHRVSTPLGRSCPAHRRGRSRCPVP
jgi:site-specific recombinase XerC